MELAVFFDARPVATISADAGRTDLVYHADWLAAPDRFPISLTMQLRAETYSAELVLPWLMNLLPEGEPLRAMTRVLGMAGEDVLGLISQTGNDLAGALSIAPPKATGEPGYRTIPDDAALEQIIAELPARPFLIDEEGVSMSLAGAQDKLPVFREGATLSIPVDGAPSTHILKPDNPRLPGSVQNEALCMTLARRIGFDVAPLSTGIAGTRSYLLVTRYDRTGTVAGDVARTHQEDFCQALGKPPGAKYQHNSTGIRGPSLPDMIELTRQHMTARDTTRLLEAAILNIAIGNVDSHAKNYSVLLRTSGATLSPLYDLMSGLAWDGITQNHAQDIGGQRRGRHIFGRHWRRMAETAGLSPRATVRRVAELTSRLLRALPDAVNEVAAMPAGAGVMLGEFSRTIEERIVEVQAHAADEGVDTPEDEVGDDKRFA
jgi:serine/threonine-protein kinase HipA